MLRYAAEGSARAQRDRDGETETERQRAAKSSEAVQSSEAMGMPTAELGDPPDDQRRGQRVCGRVGRCVRPRGGPLLG